MWTQWLIKEGTQKRQVWLNPTQPGIVTFFSITHDNLFIDLFMNLFIYTPCCENRKPYITELETKWFMIASDHKGGTNNKSNLQPKAS